MALTSADIVDARRFCGYPPAAPGGDACGTALAALDPDQVTVAQTVFLAPLRSLETAVASAGARLSTDKAAVWTRNRTEVQDRAGLFYQTRRAFCDFLGIPTGPWMSGSATGSYAEPAVLVV